MALFLTLLGGFCWTWVYIEAIRIGFKQKTYAIPFFAIGLNFAWETIHSYTFLTDAQPLIAQGIVNICWALCDLCIVYTWFRYGRRAWPARLGSRSFFAWGALVFVVSFGLQLMFVSEFGVMPGSRYAAFLQNLLMSILFIDMLWRRRGAEGQSLTIAVNKWLGTLAPTILLGFLEHRPFIVGVGLLCSVFDIIYIGMVAKAESFAEGPLPARAPQSIAARA